MVELAHTYPMPWYVLVLRYCSSLLMRTALVCAALSLLLLPFMILLEEAAVDLPAGVGPGLDEFGRTAMLTVALIGGFGVAIVFAVVRDVYRRAQLRALDRIVERSEADGIPVEWQRSALGDSRGGSMVLGSFGAVIGPIVIITAVWMLLSDGVEEFLLWTLLVGVAMTVLGVLAVRSALKAKQSPAERHWENMEPPLHPREPARQRDSDGNLVAVDERRLARQARTSGQLDAASPALRRLARVDRIAGVFMQVAMVLFVSGGLGAAGAVVLRQPCRTCEPRSFDDLGESFIDVALVAATVVLALGVLILLVATAVGAVVTVRLRATILEAAQDPTSARPPWYLLRRLLLEESPLGDLTGHLHTVAVTCLAIGWTGWMVRDVFPMSEWAAWFQPLMTAGGVLLLFHVSAWFWHRERTRLENHALMERWEN